jgi:hypothetical protein
VQKTPDYNISLGEPEDALDFVIIAKEAFNEDIINKNCFTFNSSGLKDLLDAALVDQTFLILKLSKGNEIVGYFFGNVSQCFFAKETQTICLSWFIQPKHRSLRNAMGLLRTYEEWSKQSGASIINMVNVKMDSPKLFERLGYTMTENTFVKEI